MDKNNGTGKLRTDFLNLKHNTRKLLFTKEASDKFSLSELATKTSARNLMQENCLIKVFQKVMVVAQRLIGRQILRILKKSY